MTDIQHETLLTFFEFQSPLHLNEFMQHVQNNTLVLKDVQELVTFTGITESLEQTHPECPILKLGLVIPENFKELYRQLITLRSAADGKLV